MQVRKAISKGWNDVRIWRWLNSRDGRWGKVDVHKKVDVRRVEVHM